MTRREQRSQSPVPVSIFTRYFEYARVVTEVVVTEEGVYQKDEVPDDYGGPQLELELVNAIIMINARAELLVHEFAVGEIMDKNRDSGGPIVRDGTQLYAATGSSTVDVVQTTRVNEDLEQTRKDLGEQALALLRAEATAAGEKQT